jgi:DNA-binding transcriptional MerR regulator
MTTICKQPSFFLDADVVWIDAGTPELPASAANDEFFIGELATLLGVSQRALRFYEKRGLVSPRRDGRRRVYGRRDYQRVSLVLKGKRLGFTLTEITQMIDAAEGRASAGGLRLSVDTCTQQIAFFEARMREAIEALSELRAIHRSLCVQAGKNAAMVARPSES